MEKSHGPGSLVMMSDTLCPENLPGRALKSLPGADMENVMSVSALLL